MNPALPADGIVHPPEPRHDRTMRFAVLCQDRVGEAFTTLVVHAGHDVCVFDPNVRVPLTLAAPSLRAALDGASWVVLATPVPQMREALHAVVPPLHAGQIVFDAGSLEPRRFRFMDTFKCASPALLDRLMDVDNLRQVALIALAHDDDELHEAGVSRYGATAQDKQRAHGGRWLAPARPGRAAEAAFDQPGAPERLWEDGRLRRRRQCADE